MDKGSRWEPGFFGNIGNNQCYHNIVRINLNTC